jgi:hypothetical protein
MPLQNRVRPDGEIVAVAARGLMMGNRGGRLHDEGRQLGSRRWAGKAWICCVLAFGGRHRTMMGDSYTELFFLDEATALAAGHRPCFECRRADAVRFAELWNGVRGLSGRAWAGQMDTVLHAERVAATRDPAVRRAARVAEMSDGTMALWQQQPHLVHRGRLRQWTDEGYRAEDRAGPADVVRVLTPPSVVAVLAAGYRPLVHPSGLS